MPPAPHRRTSPTSEPTQRRVPLYAGAETARQSRERPPTPPVPATRSTATGTPRTAPRYNVGTTAPVRRNADTTPSEGLDESDRALRGSEVEALIQTEGTGGTVGVDIEHGTIQPGLTQRSQRVGQQGAGQPLAAGLPPDADHGEVAERAAPQRPLVRRHVDEDETDDPLHTGHVS